MVCAAFSNTMPRTQLQRPPQGGESRGVGCESHAPKLVLAVVPPVLWGGRSETPPPVGALGPAPVMHVAIVAALGAFALASQPSLAQEISLPIGLVLDEQYHQTIQDSGPHREAFDGAMERAIVAFVAGSGTEVSLKDTTFRRLQGSDGPTQVQIRYTVRCGNQCDTVHESMSQMSDPDHENSLLFAQNIISAISQAAAASGFQGTTVVSSPAEVVAYIQAPETIQLSIPIPLHYCDPSPCLNGGVCSGENDCACPTGFTGTRCDECADGYENYPICNIIPADCVGEWSNCAASCISTYAVLSETVGTGAACPELPGATMSCDPGEGDCPAVDCAGTWSDCTAACEPATDRTWTEVTAEAGGGAACPGTTDCVPGEGGCPAVDCAGTWSDCTAACEPATDRTWTEVTAEAGGGAACPGTTDCIFGDGLCRPPTLPPVTSITTVATDSIAQTATVRLYITLDPSQGSVYAMAGTLSTTLSLPPAYQVAAPFGTNIGGVSPALFPAAAEAEFDSWLTIGADDGTSGSAISSIGIDFDSWTADSGLELTDGAVFYMDPTTMGANSGPNPILMAQMTLSADDAASGTATAQLQGKPADRDGFLDWTHSATWTWSVETPPPPSSSGTESVTVVSTDGVSGMTTVRLSYTLDATQANIYAMAGTLSSVAMSFPPAYQVAAPFGAAIGGVSPAFFAVANNDALGYAEFDSWLTIGVTDGSAPGAIAASPGFDIAALWTATTGLDETNSAVFYMDPTTMGANSGPNPIVMAQMTLSADDAASGTATASLQGRSAASSADDWTHSATWTWSAEAPPPPPPPPPPTQVDCQGSWSVCTDACEAAPDRTWTETAAAAGGGSACPVAVDCTPG
eukprot:COSAG02_NODE_4820_length_4939_cov_9.921074_2_plen_860_part_01